MNFHIPVELLDTLLALLLTAIWKSYRRVWRHIRNLELAQLRIMLMLQRQGIEVPDENDTEIFKRANDL